jgi:PhnB protein
MFVNPYVHFNGQCEEAFKFYEQLLGGQIVDMRTYADMPAMGHLPAELGPKIVHARMLIGDTVLMGSDAPPERFHTPQGFSVSLMVETAEEAERVFHGLEEGAAIIMPIEETFWAIRFGMLVDRFGIPWMVNCEKPM